jgi:hypothetical protein
MGVTDMIKCVVSSVLFITVFSEHVHPDHLAKTKTHPPFSMYIYPKDDFVSNHVRLSGMWHYGHSAIMTEVLKSLDKDSVLLDFGANIGMRLCM